LPVEISTGLKVLFFDNVVFQLHFALRIKFVTPKLENLVFVKVGGCPQKYKIISKSTISVIFLSKSTNFDENEIFEFWGYELDSKCKMELRHHIFHKKINI